MTRIKTLVLLLGATAILGWFAVGCEEGPKTNNNSDVTVTSGKLCPMGGEAKGSAKCCMSGAEGHKKHGKGKGASDCSKMSKDHKASGQKLCPMGGHAKGSAKSGAEWHKKHGKTKAKGSAKCGKPEVATCEKQGAVKKSPDGSKSK